MKLEYLINKKIHLIGISGAEISGLAIFLAEIGCRNLIGHDFKDAADFKKSFFSYHEGISRQKLRRKFLALKKSVKKINFKKDYLHGITNADFIFSSSSWFRYAENQPLKKIFQNSKIPFWNWYNFLLKFCTCKIIGVTGTAGKGTVVNVLHQILDMAKKKNFLIGDSWQEIDFAKIFAAGKNALVVAEINNRTLTFAGKIKKSPGLVIITNIFPHHLDDHDKSFAKYSRVKLSIYKNQQAGDILLINGDDPFLKRQKLPKTSIIYTNKGKLTKLVNNPYFNSSHLRSDCMAAIKAARLLGVKEADIKLAIAAFNPREGRMEKIRELKGVSFINDGAATRIKSTIQALESAHTGKIILILEGSRKNPEKLKKEFLELIRVIKRKKTKAVFISGRITSYLSPLIEKHRIYIAASGNLEESIRHAYKKAKKGDTVLFSPACESFGEFMDYRERSKKFRRIVNKLK